MPPFVIGDPVSRGAPAELSNMRVRPELQLFQPADVLSVDYTVTPLRGKSRPRSLRSAFVLVQKPRVARKHGHLIRLRVDVDQHRISIVFVPNSKIRSNTEEPNPFVGNGSSQNKEPNNKQVVFEIKTGELPRFNHTTLAHLQCLGFKAPFSYFVLRRCKWG